MDRNMQRLNVSDPDPPGFTTAQAQLYSQQHDGRYMHAGGKTEEGRTGYRQPSPQRAANEFKPVTYSSNSYNTNRTGGSMDRSPGYHTVDSGYRPSTLGTSPNMNLTNPRPYTRHSHDSPRDSSEISVPVYGTRTSEKYKYPEPAESRLVYSSPQNANFGYAQSRPATGGDTSPPTPPPPPPPPMTSTLKSNYRTGNTSPRGFNFDTSPINRGSPYSGVDSPAPRSSPYSSGGAPDSPVGIPRSPPYGSGGGHVTPDSPKPAGLERPYQLMPTMQGYQSGGDKSSVTSRGESVAKGNNNEDEVDKLTTLLMQNMEAAADPDFFGMCAKCGRAIMGETAGCKALDQQFHVDCFTCISCSACLKGQPFYAMEGRPYCESCYVTTLEKCSVCSKPITERILRATGKPYHPKCFVCVVCGKSLDGVPFTVDATNQIHCIHDFHKKFAPRCCVCDLPIMPEEGNEEAVRIVAMDRNFHPHCYQCEDCGVVLTSEADGRGCYPLDEHILCKHCNALRIQRLTNRPGPTEL